MDAADAVPKQHVPAGHLDQVAAEILVRREKDGFFLRDATDDLFGVGRGADAVAHGLHFGRAVDIGDHLVLLFQLADPSLSCSDAISFAHAMKG